VKETADALREFLKVDKPKATEHEDCVAAYDRKPFIAAVTALFGSVTQPVFARSEDSML
jgi:hypothetical protein